MASRMKEDEKNEKIIRGLLKLPANRRCINCNNLGPQYVCINFWTFICTNCSGMHREFTHRVKSISMAKFTSQEVISLQEGGNERAKEIYFKEWDPQRHMFPDSRNIDKLRDFIKHVYVERRYSGGRNNDKPPRVKGDRDDLNENKRGDSYKGGSRSPPYDDRYSERAGYGGRSEPRSPGYDGEYKMSPGHYERRQDDRFGSGNQNRKFEDRRLPDGASKPEGGSPNNQKDIASSSPPMLHPVRDILGNDMPTLRVSNPPKSNGARIPDNSAQTQRTLSSSSLGSTDGTSTQLKGMNSGSLIDFNADPEPPAPQTPQQSVPQRSLSAPADGGNWASFDIAVQQKAPQPPQAVPNATTIESELLQLSAPGSGHGGNMSILPVPSVESFPKATSGPMMQQQPPTTYTASNSQFTNTQFGPPTAGAVNQSLHSSLAPNLQPSLTAPAGHSSQVSTRQIEEKNAGLSSQLPVYAKSNGRKELPEDLFTFTYPLAPTLAPGWQRGPHVGIGYGMQYPAEMVQMIPAFTHAPKSSNPFDLNEPASLQSPRFPSMTSLQGTLPNVTSVSPLSHTSTSFGTILPSMLPQQPPSYPPATSQSPYMMQQVPGNMPQVSSNMIPTLYQGIGGPGVGAHFGSSSMDQLPAARFSQPGTPNSFGPVGSNPFG